MAILIDPPAWPAHGTLWSHLISDTSYEELHAFAIRLGIPRRGFDLDHYDLPASRYADAVALGARAVTAKYVVHALRGTGLRVRQADRGTVVPVRRREYLSVEWWALGGSLGIIDTDEPGEPGEPVTAWLSLGEELIARWSEPHRSYHNEQHLEDVLLALNHFAVRGERVSPVTLLAAWFHDVIYAGAASDERDSARLAVEALSSFGALQDSGIPARVGEFILATSPAQRLADPEPALAQLLDADLAIFAAPAHRYEQYAASVRAEYAHVGDTDFTAGRARILTGYLERTSIYSTDTARQLWEQRARHNVAAEIERLRGTAR